MNRIFKSVWSASQGAFVAVAETTRGRGKSSCGVSGALLSTVLLGVSAQAQTLASGALPTGGQVTAGQASLATQGNTLNVQQSSQRAAINWQSFNIGSGATVNFQQPNAQAVTLNRVVGGERSVIEGALNANGNVYILNANGVLFNRNAQVNVGGLVASTLNMSDADFMAGSTTFEGSGAAGSVINLGTLTAANAGHIALLGQHVANEGVITATMGRAVLAAGDKITLNFNGNSQVGVNIERGALNALVENKNAIVADGGVVTLTAKGLDEVMRTVVNNTGEVRAQTISNKSGEIYLLGGMRNDRIEVAGKLDASAPNSGDGGLIETSAANVQVKNHVKATTLAVRGRTGTWLIDPTDFNIESGSAAQTSSSVGADALSSALALNNVIIQTQSAGTETGDINVNAPVSWSANKLTLEAHGDINVNAVMSASGTSTLDIKTGFNGTTYSSPNTKYLRMGFAPDQSFAGRIDFDRAGTGLLTINGLGYTLINSRAGLESMRTALSGRFALASNVNLGGGEFEPIGYATAFTGRFDGLGHIISNLSFVDWSEKSAGLFGQTSNAFISNAGLIGASVTDGIGESSKGFGLLVGSASATRISNVYTQGTASGYEYGEMTNFVGGIVGRLLDGGVLERSYSTATIANAVNRGGLVGYLLEGGIVSNSYYAAATRTSATGMVGKMDAPVSPNGPITQIINSYSTKSPLVGSTLGSRIEILNSAWDTTASGVTSGQGTARSTSEMRTLTTFQDLTWNIVGDANLPANSYPILSWGPGGSVWRISTATAPAVIDVPYTLGVANGSFVYNGNAYSLNSIWGPSSIFGSNYSAWQAGIDYAFSMNGSTVTGFTNAGNYTGITVNILKQGFATASSGNTSGSLTIAPKTLALSAAKVYDGNTVLSGNQVNFVGLVGNETLTYTGATANSKNVVAGNFISAITLANGSNGGLASNYQLPTNLNASSAPANITPKPLSVNSQWVFANDKAYDGTTATSADVLLGAGMGSLSGLVGSETVGVSAAATFVNANAGNNKSATVAFTLSNGQNGGLATNYTMADVQTTANIFKRDVTLSGNFTANNKVYDGSTTASFATNTLALSGLVNGEALTLSGLTLDFDNPNAGNNKTVTLGGGNLTSTATGSTSNYRLNLGEVPPTTTANITPKPLSVAGTSAADKTFDGSTVAAVTAGSLSGMVGNEVVLIDRVTGQFDSPNPGQRNVTVGYTLGDGANGGLASNYSLANTSGLRAVIRVDEAVTNIAGAAARPTLLAPESGQVGGSTSDVLLPASYQVNVAGRLAALQGQQPTGNVVALPFNLGVSLGQAAELTLLSTPKANEPTAPVTLSQARVMTGSGAADGTREVRVPVSRNSLVEIVDGGVKLPGGVEQQLFVVKK